MRASTARHPPRRPPLLRYERLRSSPYAPPPKRSARLSTPRCSWQMRGPTTADRRDGFRFSSTKIEFPCRRGSCCSGSAMRLPNPPRGMVSWLGKSRSYESMLSSWRADIVSVMRWHPILRAVAAGTGSEKKNHTCAPFPDRERSTSTGRSRRRAVSANARTSSFHEPLSKSTARNQHVSSGSIG